MRIIKDELYQECSGEHVRVTRKDKAISLKQSHDMKRIVWRYLRDRVPEVEHGELYYVADRSGIE